MVNVIKKKVFLRVYSFLFLKQFKLFLVIIIYKFQYYKLNYFL